MNIKEISIDELDELVMLFNQYMVFYKQASAPEMYRVYLAERLANKEARVLIAYSDDMQPVGFVLNYHCFSSVSLGKITILNDLFVVPSHRKQGIARGLIEQVIIFSKNNGSIRIDLGTAKDNYSAQSLYEKMDFVKGSEYFSYSLAIN
ncbi:GNAT family N-acetyltransferase [Shewanella gelidimarina]|uniref:GNAT family N-acetyltransferase n=1 Tax=Shewanella gelidimarina TaxID=56813 RepID=UPI00200C8F0A|nr:GNAT family N-acetyltransferase [Shewanella gelidimarina]MCL1059237.1 GNAT family N-acetyltransferase [Shewanella gelidimarina]